MNKYRPFNFAQWIEKNRHLLKPPVGAKTLFEESGSFMIFVVGGPNKRRDFHYNETEEFFYQLEGDMNLQIREGDGRLVDVPIKEGRSFCCRLKCYTLPNGQPTRSALWLKSSGRAPKILSFGTVTAVALNCIPPAISLIRSARSLVRCWRWSMRVMSCAPVKHVERC